MKDAKILMHLKSVHLLFSGGSLRGHIEVRDTFILSPAPNGVRSTVVATLTPVLF